MSKSFQMKDLHDPTPPELMMIALTFTRYMERVTWSSLADTRTAGLAESQTYWDPDPYPGYSYPGTHVGLQTHDVP